MIADYLITIATVATLALTWRMLLLDHPALLERVKALPVVGAPLTCGFCAVLWFSLAAVLWHNPLASWAAAHALVPGLLYSWLATTAGVLALRNGIAALMEGAGVLTHLHRAGHKD